MHLVGLTGGIGSGKSSVSETLATLGAIIIDADAIVRELQRPGAPVFEAMVQRWGSDIVAESGELDRAKVAEIVFNDSEELRELEALVHPVLQDEIKRRIEAERATDHSVVLDMALLAERGRDVYNVQGVVVVDCPQSTAVARLVQYRNFSEADAEARMKNQISRDRRLAVADYVLDNSGTPDDLRSAATVCADWIHHL